MYRAHTRTCILYLYIIHIICMCVCSCAKGWPLYAYTHGKQGQTHEWNFPPRPPQRPLFAKTCQADEVSVLSWGYLWWRLGIPHLRSHYYWSIFYRFYGFVGFSRHDPVCHWESFAPTLVMACPLESWHSSAVGTNSSSQQAPWQS